MRESLYQLYRLYPERLARDCYSDASLTATEPRGFAFMGGLNRQPYLVIKTRKDHGVEPSTKTSESWATASQAGPRSKEAKKDGRQTGAWELTI
jgi:hypothetical protein